MQTLVDSPLRITTVALLKDTSADEPDEDWVAGDMLLVEKSDSSSDDSHAGVAAYPAPAPEPLPDAVPGANAGAEVGGAAAGAGGAAPKARSSQNQNNMK